MNVLIVHAHPEPKSFASALKDKAVQTLTASGHGATYETGPLKAKRAMLALTSGGPSAWYTADGVNGTINTNFYHVHHGVFWYCGMTVLEPFVAFGAGRADDAQTAAYLADWESRLRTLADAKVVYPAP